MSDLSVRLAGPVVRLPGGDLTLTVLGETRRERAPASHGLIDIPDFFTIDVELPDRTRRVTSGYAELRAPLASPDAELFFLRGLELQLAARYDRIATTLPENGTPGAPSNDQLTTLHEGAGVYTLGARVFPVPELMFGASVATGQLPPNLSDLQAGVQTITGAGSVADPRRGGARLGSEGPYVLLSLGSHGVAAQRGRTMAFGVVVDLSRRRGPRVSVDYSRIVTHGEIAGFPLSIAQLVAAEASYPGRVSRAPLTAADVSAGYTGGRIVQVDTGAINAGSTIAEAVDIKLDWYLPAGRAGDFRVYGAGTWQPTFRTRTAPDRPMIERVGYSDGLLAWRNNVGIGWERGPWGADLNLQYFDSYRVVRADPNSPSNADVVRFQGATRIPHQAYVDLALSRSFDLQGSAGRLTRLDVRLGVQNLFDKRPPIDADPDYERYYSPYGDPRRRRGELAISARF